MKERCQKFNWALLCLPVLKTRDRVFSSLVSLTSRESWGSFMQLVQDASKSSEVSRCVAWHDGWPLLRWVSTGNRRFFWPHFCQKFQPSSPASGPFQLRPPSISRGGKWDEFFQGMGWSGLFFTTTQWYKWLNGGRRVEIKLHPTISSTWPSQT